MSEWYWTEQDRRRGPCSGHELKELLANGRVQPMTLVWKQGLSEWVAVKTVRGLFDEPEPASPSATTDSPPPLPKAIPAMPVNAGAALESAKHHATAFFADLKSLNFREEVIPIDATNLASLLRDYVFWGVTMLGIVPLLIGTLGRPDYQLTTFALFFAILWGVVFKYFIVRGSSTWPILLASLFTTGIVGIFALSKLYEHVLPAVYLNLIKSESGLVRLFGFIVQVGICEELCKTLPIIGYLLWKRRQSEASTVVLIGVFSGLGFAAFENIDYGFRSIERSYELTRQHGAAGGVIGTADAMVNVMLRSLSLVFCHSVWSGIVGYFLAVAWLAGKRRGALLLVGLLTASVLHGIYDWLVVVLSQPTFAAFVVAASFMLFYAYLSKLRALTTSSMFVAEPVPEATTTAS
jgi:RsiW-degrading membrane proteinase PrsW (M82 family)